MPYIIAEVRRIDHQRAMALWISYKAKGGKDLEFDAFLATQEPKKRGRKLTPKELDALERGR